MQHAFIIANGNGEDFCRGASCRPLSSSSTRPCGCFHRAHPCARVATGDYMLPECSMPTHQQFSLWRYRIMLSILVKWTLNVSAILPTKLFADGDRQSSVQWLYSGGTIICLLFFLDAALADCDHDEIENESNKILRHCYIDDPLLLTSWLSHLINDTCSHHQNWVVPLAWQAWARSHSQGHIVDLTCAYEFFQAAYLREKCASRPKIMELVGREMDSWMQARWGQSNKQHCCHLAAALEEWWTVWSSFEICFM